MCAIAGSHNENEVKKMLALMRYRGPDDTGLSTAGAFTLGMARLRILDTVSTGLCPIKNGEYTLVFNGELYNYLELREELKQLGHTFHTEGDSEVLLAAYKQWGADCLDTFNWMGAFAISDGKKIFIARDIAGEKPLYYSTKPFRFASEAKVLNWECEEFPPAHYALYDNGELIVRKWWTPPQEETYQGTFDEAVGELDVLLEDSVRLRTRAHVPYGLYFSGGIDSALISTYHQFPALFTYNDAQHTAEDFTTIFPKILWHLDHPVTTFSPFGLWKLAEQATRQGIKVVLSGEGADELFGGYVRYVPNELNRKAREVFPSYPTLFPYTNMLMDEFNGNMRELLRMGDRMAAAHSIENRAPFLDRRIIEFAMRLPMELKIQGFETKVIVRALLKKRLPSYQFEEKQGLFCSVNTWLGVPEEGFEKKTYMQIQKKLHEKYLRGQHPDAIASGYEKDL